MTMTTTVTALDTGTLLAAASAQAGLSDFGDPSFREGLDVLVKALNDEARLTEAASGRVAASIVATLVNRLQVEDHLARHPQLLDAPIVKPTFVFGLPRTGTTLAINLLAADPARRSFMRWEAFASAPPAAKGELRSDPRYHAEQAKLDMSLKYVPHISAMHHEDADSSCECQFAMSPTFCSQVYDSQYDVPSYHAWFMKTDYRPAFRYHKRLMQLLQQDNKGHWTFKNPWHPLYLDALTEIYPDAQLVMTHRDPADVVASACSLVYAVRKLYSEDVDPIAVAEVSLETFGAMIDRTLAYEAKHGAGSIHHIQYKELTADPIGEMHKLYAHFGDALTDDAVAAMQNMLDSNPQGKHGKHAYALEDYGLTRDKVYSHFADYIERFAIPVKG
ncbi:sulfotransferase family protein [Blastomonas fulva]|uniref:sulfotransferase family protein n=1 Tax=Blastomonas fulva TaxID=1550728 RepID=UPI0025A495C5|nr:sulfotransferase [Blastomonas fulva]MDM7929381.1 sulfotransferase [Blastomonas fulva]MDM7965342.1 sulfotransferase [Blastomonas fulva]